MTPHIKLRCCPVIKLSYNLIRQKTYSTCGNTRETATFTAVILHGTVTAVQPNSVGNHCMLMLLRMAMSDCVMCRKIKRKANGRTKDHCFLLMVIFFCFSFSKTVTSFFLLFFQCFDASLLTGMASGLRKILALAVTKGRPIGPWPNLEWSLVKRPVRQKLENEGLRERTEPLDVFLFFRPSLNGVLFPMFCLLVEGECRILVF